MATTEQEIREAISLLVQKFGQLTTSDVKKRLPEVMPFDDDDLQPSSSRPNENVVTQRIGNVVSHQTETKKTYYDLYEIDKTESPAVFKALVGLKTNGTNRSLSKDEVKLRQKNIGKFIPKKIDWDKVNSHKTRVGAEGENFAMRFETKRVLEFANLDTERIVHLSATQGDGAGFDILSIDKNGEPVYIEVKTTNYNVDTPFYMSKNEKDFFESRDGMNDTFIYYIYNFDEEKLTGDVKIIACEDLLANYVFDPISYQVRKK